MTVKREPYHPDCDAIGTAMKDAIKKPDQIQQGQRTQVL